MDTFDIRKWRKQMLMEAAKKTELGMQESLNENEAPNEAEYYGVDRDTEMRAAGIGGSTNYMPWKNAKGFIDAVKRYVKPADIQSLSTSRVTIKPGSKTFMTFTTKDGFDMDKVVETIGPGLERMVKVESLHFLIQKIDANSFTLSAKKPNGTFTDNSGNELNIDKSSKYYIGESLNEEMTTYKVNVVLADPYEGGPDYSEEVEVKIDASLSGDDLKDAVRDAVYDLGYTRRSIYKMNYEKPIIKEWGSSDQYYMNQSIHKDLGNPTEFPGLSQIMYAAEDAVDFYWDDWDEYQTDRDSLITQAAQRYVASMFPKYWNKMRDFLSPLEENMLSETSKDWPKEVPSRYGEYTFKLVKVMSDRAKYDVIDVETGKAEIGGRTFRTVDHLKASAEDLIKPQGGRQSSQFEEGQDKGTSRRKHGLKEDMSLEDQAKAYYLAKVKRGEIDKLPKDPKAAFLAQMTKDQIDHDKETLRRERGLEENKLTESKSEAAYELREIMDQLYELSDRAKQIIKSEFPSEYRRLDAYGALDFGSSRNQYDVSFEKALEDLDMYQEDEDIDENKTKSMNEVDFGLADLRKKGYIAGKKAAYTHGTLVTKLKNLPDQVAFKKGFVQGVIEELESNIDENINEDNLEEIGMFHDPIGYRKSEPHPKDKIFTKKFAGNSGKKGYAGFLYDIYKNGVKIATIEGEGEANAYMNKLQRELPDDEDLFETKKEETTKQTTKRIIGLIKNLVKEMDPRDEHIKAYIVGVKEDLKSGDTSRINQYRDIHSLDDLKDSLNHYLTHEVDQLDENKFDVAATEKIAQAVADAFTAEDDLDLKYIVTPGTEESSFDLDVKAGPNTPGPEWRDKNGFSIDNYLGDFAGGSFYIEDGVVYNAAMRNAPIANVSPEGEVEMISAADLKAAQAFANKQNKKQGLKESKTRTSYAKSLIDLLK